jgi:hypothetical protein
MTTPNHTFELGPHSKTRYSAGPYDPTSHSPRYTIEMSTPDDHVQRQVDVEQVLMGTEGNYIWVWVMNNKSTWPVFVSVMKDGMLVTGTEHG